MHVWHINRAAGKPTACGLAARGTADVRTCRGIWILNHSHTHHNTLHIANGPHLFSHHSWTPPSRLHKLVVAPSHQQDGAPIGHTFYTPTKETSAMTPPRSSDCASTHTCFGHTPGALGAATWQLKQTTGCTQSDKLTLLTYHMR
jgi:hypothetical protein